MYAIVDIETTGGHAGDNGITEIAIIIHDGKSIVEKFTTLINPQRHIPSFIESYIGITNEMVEDAPTFAQIADKVYELLHDKIFVAHNVNFDYTFIKHHLLLNGYQWNAKKACTVRLSRKLLPGYPSYSLGNLCASLGIAIHNRHRAMGDAAATAVLFQKLLDAPEGLETIQAAIKKGSKEANLPANLPKEQYEALPLTTGVYYFYDEKGKIIYVGKALNIKKRVTQHFGGTNTTEKRQAFLKEIYHVGYEETATELMALILESIEIKKHWPKHNKSQKSLEFNFGVFDYEDQNGYLRLGIDRVRKNVKPLHTFKRITDAFQTLQKLVLEFGLCPKLCLINTAKEACGALLAGCCKGACELSEPPTLYNLRAYEAINFLTTHDSYAILDKGKSHDEYSCILVSKGRFYGMGYISQSISLENEEVVKNYIKPHKGNYFIQELIHAQKQIPGKLIYFNQA